MKLLTILMLSAIAVGCGYGSHSTTPPMAGVTPTISMLVPASETHGTDFLLTVDGANFGSKAVVNFNGKAMATAWVNAGQVTTQIPGSAIMNAGVVPVTVTNPAVAGGGTYGGGGTSAATS